MPDIRDIFDNQDAAAVNRVKEIGKWLNSLPVSELPFVDIGFDTLETDMIQAINQQRDDIENNFNNVNLNLRQTEIIPSKFLYMERFPFWASAFPENDASKFKVGDRVMNLCSIKRAFVPFGIRGTVVGKTEQKVVVMYDEQFI